MAYNPATENKSIAWRTLAKSLSFKGRSDTAEVILLYMLVGISSSFLISTIPSWSLEEYIRQYFSNAIYAIITFIMAALTVRRLHDLDWSGWWAIPLLSPFIFSYVYKLLFQQSIYDHDRIFPIVITINILAVISVFVVALKPGSPEANRHGKPLVFRPSGAES